MQVTRLAESILHDLPLLPLANGELVFGEPWQARVFGMALALAEAGHYGWDEFRAVLMEDIARWERSEEARSEPFRYYDRLLAALQRLLLDRGLCSQPGLDRLVAHYESLPEGHDHA